MISIRGVTKQYGSLRAVNNLHLDVGPGETLGFLGLNGAGKTTSIRILLGLLRPTHGSAFILGHDCQSDGLQARARIGYLPGEMGVFADMTGLAVLDLLAGLSGNTVNATYRRELQERLQFPDSDVRRKFREYSTGMKRKLGLIQAFQADPLLLILDEPTEGLDPLMQESFYELVADVKRRGRTVFMSSHLLSEVDRVCDRIALLRKGELVLLSTMEEIRNLAARHVRVAFSGEVAPPIGLPPGSEILESSAGAWRLRVQGELGPLLHFMGGLPIKDLEVSQPRLEDAVLKYYREGRQ